MPTFYFRITTGTSKDPRPETSEVVACDGPTQLAYAIKRIGQWRGRGYKGIGPESVLDAANQGWVNATNAAAGKPLHRSGVASWICPLKHAFYRMTIFPTSRLDYEVHNPSRES